MESQLHEHNEVPKYQENQSDPQMRGLSNENDNLNPNKRDPHQNNGGLAGLNMSTLFLTGHIETFHREDLEYEVVTAVSGLSPLPTLFFQKVLQEHNSNIDDFSEAFYRLALRIGYVIDYDPRRVHHTWIIPEVDGSQFGIPHGPLFITITLYKTASYKGAALRREHRSHSPSPAP
ncbi:hypothetical protein TWF788_008245 [Orbilia oligospora]|uniref:Uncharacterized protein n=1 Tax=Orbilia oligospora TaxID=2813651 RepID=A0A7C8U3U5_ORBOL|nr:hypothetical protein TWF788_008245 [Orbilia oligospora]